MAGLGEMNFLSDSELSEKFSNAAIAGKDYLVKVSYTSDGVPMGMQGTTILLDMIDINEDAFGVDESSLKDELVDIHSKVGRYRIEAVYDLRQPFSQSAAGDETMLPASEVKAAKAEMERNEKIAEWNQKSWVGKLFSRGLF